VEQQWQGEQAPTMMMIVARPFSFSRSTASGKFLFVMLTYLMDFFTCLLSMRLSVRIVIVVGCVLSLADDGQGMSNAAFRFTKLGSGPPAAAFLDNLAFFC
jgi:hypothetical protein